MGHKRKKRPTRPHCKMAPRKATPNKPKREMPDFDVRLQISKKSGEEGYDGNIIAKDTDTLVEALAVMMQRAAALIGAPTEQVYAVVATLLFNEENAGDPVPEGEG